MRDKLSWEEFTQSEWEGRDVWKLKGKKFKIVKPTKKVLEIDFIDDEKCDTCKQTVSTEEYKRNKGLCNECVAEVN